MTNDRETENARERLAVRLRETLGAAVREIRPSRPRRRSSKTPAFGRFRIHKAAERCFWRARIRRTAATRCHI